MDQLDLFGESQRDVAAEDAASCLTIFLAAPSHADPRTVERRFAVVRSVCADLVIARGYEVRFLSGDDAPELRRDVADWMEHTFADGVDALVALFGDSWGAGQQELTAKRLRIPRLVLVEDRSKLNGLVCSREGDALGSCGAFGNDDELRDAVQDWLKSSFDSIVTTRSRRKLGIDITEPMRMGLLRNWETLESPLQQRISERVGRTSRQLGALLCDSGQFGELPIREKEFLCVELGLGPSVQAERGKGAERVLSDQEEDAFYGAWNDFEWDLDTAFRVYSRGVSEKADSLQVQMAGHTRRSFVSRNAWLRVFNEVCSEHEN